MKIWSIFDRPSISSKNRSKLTVDKNSYQNKIVLDGQDDGRLAILRVSKGTPSTNVGSVTGLLEDAPALVQLAGQDDGRLTVSTVSKCTVSTKRPTGRTDGR